MSSAVLLVANRAEIAIRVLRAASDLGIETVAVHSEDDAASLHVRHADRVRALSGSGPAAYLDAEQMLAVAAEVGATAIHPGYGFLSESAEFARQCESAGVVFVGPRAETLALLGDKLEARALARRHGVRVLDGSEAPVDLEAAAAFQAALPSGEAMLVKAVAGGGGRGMRVVESAEALPSALERCRSEAAAAFGVADVYVERWLPRARHVEVQVVGDGSGAVAHLYERECSLQRANQKLVEIAPCPGIAAGLRSRLTADALRLARSVHYRSLGTLEFLVPDPEGDAIGREDAEYVFIEANPRLQVEHTVSEAVLGIDLVALQLRLALGAGLEELGLTESRIGPPRGVAVQCRVNMEAMSADGRARPTGGTLTAFGPPSGPGVRVDTFGYAGYTTSPRFDSLLAKVIVHAADQDLRGVLRRAGRALAEFQIEGVETNRAFLQRLLRSEPVVENRLHTRLVGELCAQGEAGDPVETAPRYFAGASSEPAASAGSRRAGTSLESDDPLAVLDHGKQPAVDPAGASGLASPATPGASSWDGSAGVLAIRAPLQGTIIEIHVSVGEHVHAGQQLLVMEAMKMEHVLVAEQSGIVRGLGAALGEAVFAGHDLVYVEPADVATASADDAATIDLDHVRADLEEVHARHAAGQDDARPEAVARRRKTGQRTTRENVEDLCDPGTFNEYGALVIAAQRRRRTLEDLIARTPGDGLVAGVGQVNGALFPPTREVEPRETRCVIMSYDYTVLAGTQGAQNHRKKDRMFELAERWRLPVVFFTEGGGGRPGDTDSPGVAGLDCLAFHYFGRLSGLVPLVGITSGRCFAGNAALLGCCDVVIATAGSNIGMGGPAMIEGGGLGVFRPEEVGPMHVQVPNGVVDIPVDDEAEAVAVARRYLAYFQGPLADYACADQRALRHAIPENRLRIYDVREVIRLLFDTDSVLELRRQFGLGMVTALARVEGRPIGVIANNPVHLAGAIDSDGADKAARFMQLCDAFDLPIVSLCDTPGIMVGPEAEKEALVRHASRMFVTSASLTVPLMTIVLRKGYGLGAQAMAGGSFHAPVFTVSWPTGEFGGMGLEGAVKLGFRNELAAIEDAAQRKAMYEEMVERMYEHGKAVNMASHFEIDDVIDPVETRAWITNTLRAMPPPPPRTGKKRPCIDTW